jgi:ligand-binding SRPBCC domain-containing protein
MIEVEASTHVDAPRTEVFGFMDEPRNQAVITPSITDIRNVEPLDNGGKQLEYTYTMGGVDLEGSLETPVYEPAERVVFDMDQGPLTGTIVWTFEDEDGGTRVTYAAAYELPSTVLETAARPFVERYNERELRTTLANLRDQFVAGGESSA